MKDNSRPKTAILQMTGSDFAVICNIFLPNAVFELQWTEKPIKDKRKKKDILPGDEMRQYKVYANNDKIRKAIEVQLGYEIEWESQEPAPPRIPIKSVPLSQAMMKLDQVMRLGYIIEMGRLFHAGFQIKLIGDVDGEKCMNEKIIPDDHASDHYICQVIDSMLEEFKTLEEEL